MPEPRPALDERGNWGAPEGSGPWARAVFLKVKVLYERVQDEENELGSWVQALQRHMVWKVFGFQSWEALCQARWSDGGLGIPPEALQGEITRRALLTHGGDRRSATVRMKGQDQGDKITLKRGTQAAYLLARLIRDHPALAHRVQAGELSAHRAAIEAGFRRPTVTVPADNVEQAVHKLIARYGLAAVRKALEACRE